MSNAVRWTPEQYEAHMQRMKLDVPDRRTERDAVMADMPPADDSAEADYAGEEAYRRANTPPMQRGGHEYDDAGLCVHCGFDGAEHHWWRNNTYEGRAFALEGRAHEPACRVLAK